MTTNILIAVCCLFSILNFLSILFLSNSLFHILLSKEEIKLPIKNQDEKGLVDLKESPTYDSRFKNQ